eukprot:GILI01028282.1.p1 GENE.GILI01028282.1~~GILI01028282.1.p1  ORF type:complete len:140 (+),score=16.39 GILI01028282.1:196-615(+)
MSDVPPTSADHVDKPPSLSVKPGIPAASADEEEERAYQKRLEEDSLKELLARNRPAAYQNYGLHMHSGHMPRANSGSLGTFAGSSQPHHQPASYSHFPKAGGLLHSHRSNVGDSSRSPPLVPINGGAEERSGPPTSACL